MLERGRLYSLRKDGTKDSLYFNIRSKRFLFGSSEYCTIRIYMDGIFSEHCVLTIGDQGKAYLEPLHPSALTLVNGIKIKHKVCLKDSDVLTISVKEFQFTYPSNSLSKNMFFDKLILLYSKQMKPIRNSCSDNSLTKYTSQHIKKSPEERKNLTLKLYDFVIFLRRVLNMNEDYINDLLPILESVWNNCIAKASQDILFLPLKFLDLEVEISVYKKSLQSRIRSCTSENSSPVSHTMSEKKNHCKSSFEVSVSSNCKIAGQNQYSSRKISCTYKKRVSLAVKRYHLRKRKSIMCEKTSAAESRSVTNSELSGERSQVEDRFREINSDEQKGVLNLEKQETIRIKRKRGYNKKEKESRDKKQLKISLVQESEKRSMEYSTREQTTNTKLSETKAKKRNYKRKKKETVANETGKSTQEYDLQKLSCCQRVTRSMTKNCH